MEMSGLDPQYDRILEIAMVITDADIDVIKKFKTLTIHHDLDKLNFNIVGDKKTTKKIMTSFKKTGLLDRVRKSKTSIEQAEKIILERLQKFCQRKKCHLAGSSVWMDAEFIRMYMPKVWEYVHYKLLDVTALKLLREAWFPDVPEYPKKDLHDATEDVLESIEQLKYYREKIFKS